MRNLAVLLVLLSATSFVVAEEPRSDPQVDARVAELTKILKTGNDEARFEAALALAELGPRAASAVPALIKELKRDPGGNLASLDALVRIGAAAAPALAELLDAGDYRVRSVARDGLTELGPEAAAVAPLLVKKLIDKENSPIWAWNIRQTEDCGVAIASTYGSPVDMLAAMRSKAVPYLAPALSDERRDMRGGAAFALGEMGPEAKDAVPALIAALKRELAKPTPDEALWSMYVWALGRIGPAAKDAIPLLHKTLAEYRLPKEETSRDDDLDVVSIVFRQSDPFTMAAMALANISPHDPSTLAVVLDRLKRERLPRASTASFWSDFGVNGARQLAALVKHENPRVRRTSARALHWTSLKDASDAATVVPEMIALLDDKEFHSAALTCLGKIGPPAKAALPKLLPLLSDENDRDTVSSAAGAILRIDPDNRQAIDYFVRELKQSDPDRRRSAVAALSDLGPCAQASVPSLIECLDSPSAKFRAEVAITLGTMKSQAEIVIPALAKTLRDQADPEVSVYHRHGPIYALAELGPDSVPYLIRALDDDALVSDAVNALGGLGPAAEPAVPKLIEQIDKHPNCNTIKTLGSIGKGAKAAVPALETLLKDKWRWRRKDARDAIKKIEG